MYPKTLKWSWPNSLRVSAIASVQQAYCWAEWPSDLVEESKAIEHDGFHDMLAFVRSLAVLAVDRQRALQKILCLVEAAHVAISDRQVCHRVRDVEPVAALDRSADFQCTKKVGLCEPVVALCGMEQAKIIECFGSPLAHSTGRASPQLEQVRKNRFRFRILAQIEEGGPQIAHGVATRQIIRRLLLLPQLQAKAKKSKSRDRIAVPQPDRRGSEQVSQARRIDSGLFGSGDCRRKSFDALSGL